MFLENSETLPVQREFAPEVMWIRQFPSTWNLKLLKPALWLPKMLPFLCFPDVFQVCRKKPHMHTWHMAWDSGMLHDVIPKVNLRLISFWTHFRSVKYDTINHQVLLVSSCVHLCNWTSCGYSILYYLHAQQIMWLWSASLLYQSFGRVFSTPGCHAMLPIDQRLNLLELEVQQLRAHQNHVNQWLSLQDVPMMYLVGLKTHLNMGIHKIISYQLGLTSEWKIVESTNTSVVPIVNLQPKRKKGKWFTLVVFAEFSQSNLGFKTSCVCCIYSIYVRIILRWTDT